MYAKLEMEILKTLLALVHLMKFQKIPEIHVLNNLITLDEASKQIITHLKEKINTYQENKMKYSMFIGRWQPLHKGHLWLINQRLKEGKNVWLAIRDVEPDKNNPWTAKEIENGFIHGELKDLIADGRVITSIIPDIESVNYGRGVGYEIIEHIPPNEIGEISATSIREKMRKDGKL